MFDVEIPKIIHRIWLGDPMPDRFAEYRRRWEELHPGWLISDWRDRVRLPRLRNQDLFDRAREIYPKDWKRFEADLLRLELLWQYGGVYADTDVEPRKPLDGLVVGHSFLVGRSPQHIRGHHPITNAVIASVARHSFLDELIDQIPAAIHRYRRLSLAQSVGPWHLTRIFESRPWPDVTVLDWDQMYDGHWFVHHWNTAARKRGQGVW